MNHLPEPQAGAAVGGRNVVAVLGPTNTGKTHLAIERMVAHGSGVIGLPLRLLAREVYNRVAARVGNDQVALITGEEKIVPPNPRFRVCTVEAMPTETDASFLAIDEIQLAGDLERGHVFTDRLLNLRGRDETLLLGAATMRGIIEKLLPEANIVTRPRMSVLTYSGPRKITRLPRRSAVVAFSADEVYAIAELVRRQRGGAAVVLGSLSPRTRNAQVEIFQNGDVDFLIATDAIGMGLNLDVDHVAFAADRKFDGYQFRQLSAAELGQIAGRAGRHMRDGSFGVTSRVGPLDDALVEALETHRFDPVKVIQWRNRSLDFDTIDALKASLDMAPDRDGLTKAPPSEDVVVLDIVARDEAVKALADRPERVSLLWDICQIPDYRKIAPANHAELVSTLFRYLARDGVIEDDWFDGQVAYADRTDGDIDTLANRIAHIRTWTFAANRPQWLRDPYHWQERTRAIEDRLSDALHDRLTQRFVDRRTSVLMRRLKENAMLEAEITADGDVVVEGQHVGNLDGFRFAPDPNADGPEAKALRAAAQKALAGEIATRAERLAASDNGDFVLSNDGTLRWRGTVVARLASGNDPLAPRLILLADESLTQPDREKVQTRIDLWLGNHLGTLLKPLFDLRDAESLPPVARGLAFRLAENYGIIERAEIAEEVRGLDQDARAGMRALGVRFGAYHIYVPQLVKPAPSSLLAMLWALHNGGLDTPGLAELCQIAASGRTSVAVDPTFATPLYQIVGYRLAGSRAVRIDILERLADLIRPLIAWRPTPDAPEPPDGAIDGYGFTVTVAMTSLLGCSGDDFASVLRSLGYRMERRLAPPPPSPVEQTPPAPAADAPADKTEAAADPGETPAASAATTEPMDNATSAVGALPADATVAGNAAPVTERSAPATEAAAPVEAPAVPPEPVSTPPQETAAAATEDAAVAAGAENATIAAAGQAAGPAATAADGVADATAEHTPPPEATASDAATAEAPAEPAFVEVWRPGRSDRRRQPPRDRRRHGKARTGSTDAAQSGDGEAGPKADSRRDGAPRRKGKPRHDRKRKRPPEGDQKPRFADTAPKAPAARRDRPPDPDSPFAALAALKAELEAKSQDD